MIREPSMLGETQVRDLVISQLPLTVLEVLALLLVLVPLVVVLERQVDIIGTTVYCGYTCSFMIIRC